MYVKRNTYVTPTRVDAPIMYKPVKLETDNNNSS